MEGFRLVDDWRSLTDILPGTTSTQLLRSFMNRLDRWRGLDFSSRLVAPYQVEDEPFEKVTNGVLGYRTGTTEFDMKLVFWNAHVAARQSGSETLVDLPAMENLERAAIISCPINFPPGLIAWSVEENLLALSSGEAYVLAPKPSLPLTLND